MRFLIIDDDNKKIDTVKQFLEGHEVVIAQSYDSGMTKIVSAAYDGIILDMAFPMSDNEPWKVYGVNGLCVLSEMKRKKINTPVVIYSSSITDVSEYENVKDYILNNNTYIGDKVKGFINLCSVK